MLLVSGFQHTLQKEEQKIIIKSKEKEKSSFGGNLRNLRKIHGMSQPELARKLGITKQAISNWENNNIMPSSAMLKKLSQVLAVSIETILGEEIKYVSVEGLTSEQIVHIQLLINDMKR
ncbi:MAG: helix-turn-helix transcriptional regulator [Lachnospiraceae bacterium]|nr:helix-turn-helix transcriptional regulator [Lachnospiraceae bacterium]